jgi:hypothetical protein
VFSLIFRAQPASLEGACGSVLATGDRTGADESHSILHHEVASNFLGQAPVSAKYSAFMALLLMDLACVIRFNAGN